MSSEADSFLNNFALNIKKRWIEMIEAKVDDLIGLFSTSYDQQVILIINFLLSTWLTETRLDRSQLKSGESSTDPYSWINNVFSQLLTINSGGKNEGDILNEWLIYELVKEYDISLDPSKWSILNAKIVLRRDNGGDMKIITQMLENFNRFDREKVSSALDQLIGFDPFLAELLMLNFEKYSVLDLRYNFRPCYQQALISSLDRVINPPLDSKNSFSTEVDETPISSVVNYDQICKIINVLSDQQLANEKLHKLLTQFLKRAMKDDSFDWDHFYSSVIGRCSNEFIQALTKVEWSVRQSAKISLPDIKSDTTSLRCPPKSPYSSESSRKELTEFPTSMFNVVIDPETKEWDTNNSFLLATIERKHFLLNLFESSSTDLTLIPDELKLFHLISNILKYSNELDELSSHQKVEIKSEIDKIEELIVSPSFNSFLEQNIVLHNLKEILQWIFKCIDLCKTGHDSDSHEQIRMHVFRKLVSGSSPLHVFKQWANLQNHSLFPSDSFEAYQRIAHLLLSKTCKSSDIMIWNGHLVLKLVIFRIFDLSFTDEEMTETLDQLAHLVNQIQPITFRLEILENLFSLLLLTKKDVLPNVSKLEVGSIKSSATEVATDIGGSSFIFPNFLIPNYLTVLKDCACKAQSKLFILKRLSRETSTDQSGNSNNLDLDSHLDYHSNIESSITSHDECKTRLRKLMDYINDAQWRFSVIEPSLYVNDKSIPPEIGADVVEIISLDGNESFCKEIPEARISDNDSTSTFDLKPESSIIPYMLASPCQLLRYCLLHSQIDRAKQVQKLFEEDLKDSYESCELLVLEKVRELTRKFLNSIKSRRSSSTWLLGGDRTPKQSPFQSILSDFMADIDSKTNGKINSNHLLVDYSVCTSPLFEISTTILESCLRSFSSSQPEICKKDNEAGNALLCMIIKIVNIFKDSSSQRFTSLPQVLAYCPDSNLFLNPASHLSIVDRLEVIRQSITEFKQILGDESSIVDSGISSPQSPNKIDSRALLIRYQKLVSNFPGGKFNYLKALFYHVKRVSDSLVEARKRSESFVKNSSTPEALNHSSPGSSSVNPLNRDGNYFSVLYTSPSAILCSMVIKYGIAPKIVDDLAREMKVDLLGTLCSVTCPYIPSSAKQDEDAYDFTLIDSFHPALCELIQCYLTGSVDMESSVMIQNHFDDERPPDEGCERKIIQNPELVDYFRKKSWILASLLKILNLIDSFENEEVSSRMFDPQSPLQKWINLVKSTLTTNTKEDPYLLVSLALYPRIPINNSLVMRALERCAVNQDYSKIHKILQLLDLKNKNSSLEALQTALLLKLTKETGDVNNALQMSCARTMRDLVVELIFTSPTYLDEDSAVLALKSALSRVYKNPDQSSHNLVEESLKSTQHIVHLYAKIAVLSSLRSWRDAYDSLSEIDILTIIKSRKNYSLIRDWQIFIEDRRPIILPKALKDTHETNQSEVENLRQELLLLAYCSNIRELPTDESSFPDKLIKSPAAHRDYVKFLSHIKDPSDLVEKVLPAVEDLTAREKLIRFILASPDIVIDAEKSQCFSDYLLGIELIQLLPTSTWSHYEPLVTKPFLIVEQMLMNLEHEPLEQGVKTLKNLSCDHLIEIYARKAVDVEIIDSESIFGSDTTMISSSVLTEFGQFQSFRMPAVIPSKEQWVPDYRVSVCMLCKMEKFSMFNRRHHCRRCGRVICNTCSQKLLLITEISDRHPVRVCDDCYAQTRMETAQSRKESTSSTSSATISKIQWILSPKDSENEAIREEFYYQSAPSSSLCLSLLKMHSDKRRCAQVIIDYLTKPLFETFSSNRVDYGLIINLIRSLLLSAKVLIGDEDSKLSLEIDFLLSRVDIVKMLVEGNCANRDLISLVTLKENAAIRLQEKLIEMERFDLAYHIATKYGINLKQIWKTWAMVCLKHGQFAEARKKFKPCFVSKSSSNNDINSKLLQEIFDVFDTIKGRVGNSSLRDRCRAITSGQAPSLVKKISVPDGQDECTLHPDLIEEGVYYLENFGSKEDTVRFYVRFGHYKQAINVFLDDRNSRNFLNIFVTRLLLPVIKCGNFKKLMNLTTTIDPTFNKTWKFWIYACKYFSNNNHFHILHTIQVFMGDYIRAAMTQISFFLTPKATDYGQLYSRIDNLLMAKQHCQYFLANQDRINKGCLVFAKEEVQKQIQVIDMQIEITKRFYNKKITLPKALVSLQETSENNGSKISDSSLPHVPTILDDSILSKTQIAVMVLLEYESSISDSFSIARQIIDENNLDPGQVYRLSGKILATSKKVNLVQLISQLLESIRMNHDPKESLGLCDDVIGTILRHCPTLESGDQLIKMISCDINKIDAYITTGKLKSAYLLAAHLHRVSDIKRILAASIRMKQDYVTKICQMWLEKNP